MKPKFMVGPGIEPVASMGVEKNMAQIDEEIAKKMAEEAAEMAVEKALAKKKKKRDEDYEDEGGRDELGINPRSLKALENMANAFGAMKKVFSNPLQDAVENKVGGRAAEIVERVFSPPSAEAPKKDLVEQILNSQFAFGFGSGLGQRGPELVDKLTTIYGPDRAERWLDGIVAGGGKGGFGGGFGGGAGGAVGRGVGGGTGGGVGGGSEKRQSEMELIMSLDPNNPEHVSAYAASQGGVRVDIARKMLMIHQDEFVNQMKMREDIVGEGAGAVQEGVPENVREGVIENVQEYRTPIQRSQELMPVIPRDEDNRWDEKHDKIVRPGELQPQNREVDGQEQISEHEQRPADGQSDVNEITGYLKQLNDYVVDLRSMVERQNNEIFNLRGELDTLKGAERVSDSPVNIDNVDNVDNADSADNVDNVDNEQAKETEDVVPDDIRTDVVPDDIRTEVGTGVRSIKTIKKGFSYVKVDKEE